MSEVLPQATAPQKRPAPELERDSEPAKQQRPTPETYLVYTTGRDQEEEAVKTIVGEYVEKGVNHGRKVYLKVRGARDPVSVLLYYWDGRDGPDGEGWWIGNKLGGSQVWSCCRESAMFPPAAGWRIPWDGMKRKTLRVVNKEARDREEAEATFQKLTSEAATLEYETTACVERARLAAERVGAASASSQALAEEVRSLWHQSKEADALLRQVTEALGSMTPELKEPLRELEGRIAAAQASVSQALPALRLAQELAEDREKQSEAEGKESEALDVILKEAKEKAGKAEDMVDKTAIAFDMVAACGDDEGLIRQAIEDTDAAAKLALAAVDEAQFFLKAKLPMCRRMQARAVKVRALTEMGSVQTQLKTAQARLAPLKAARQDWERQCVLQKIVAEAEDRLTDAEAKVRRSQEAVSALREESMTKDLLAAALSQLQAAEEQVDSTAKFLDTKSKEAECLDVEEFTDMKRRCDSARASLQKLRATAKEASERVTISSYVQEAESRMQSVAEAIGKLEATSALVSEQRGAPSDDSKAIEAASTAAQTAVSMARMFLQMKTIEVRRFSEGLAAEAVAKLEPFQRQLESSTKELQQVKSGIARRRFQSVFQDMEASVARVEELVAACRESASRLGDNTALAGMSTAEIRKVIAELTARERETSAALIEARRFLTAKQIEARSKLGSSEVPAEFATLQARLATCQTEAANHRKLPGSVEKQLEARQAVDQAGTLLDEIEEKVAGAACAVGELESAEDAGDKIRKDAEVAVQQAQIALRSTSRQLEAQARSLGCARDAFQKLESRLKEAQARLDDCSRRAKEHAERVFSDALLMEVTSKIKECEDAVLQAEAADKPFQDALKRATADQSSDAIHTLDKAIQAAQTLASSARTLVSMKRLSAARISQAAGAALSEALNGLQSRAETAAKRVSELRSRTATSKRAVLQKEALAA